MPYASIHYPFQNSEQFHNGLFPADFIAEGLDQTRGWFYTLTVLGNKLFKTSPFKNVIVNGIVLAEDGKKMSKSLKNHPDPTLILDQYGSDALRRSLPGSSYLSGTATVSFRSKRCCSRSRRDKTLLSKPRLRAAAVWKTSWTGGFWPTAKACSASWRKRCEVNATPTPFNAGLFKH